MTINNRRQTIELTDFQIEFLKAINTDKTTISISASSNTAENIAGELEDCTADKVRKQANTLMNLGFIEAGNIPSNRSGPSKKTYTLTDFGKKKLEELNR